MPAGVSAYVPLANVTLGSTATSVTFSSISGSYRDLILVADVLGTGTGYAELQVNNNTSSANYNILFMRGNGSTAATGAYSAASLFDYPVFYSTSRTSFITQIFDYSATDKHKTALTRSNNANTAVEATVGRWINTSAITTLKFSFFDIAAGSTFALYGVSA